MTFFENYAWLLGLWCIAGWLSMELDQELFTRARAAESWVWAFMRSAQPGFWLIAFEVVGHYVPDPLERGWNPTQTFGIYAQLWFVSMLGWGIQRALAKRHNVEFRFPGDTVRPENNGP